MSLSRCLLLATFVVLLNACVSQPRPSPIENWDSYQARLSTQLNAWKIEGKLGVRSPDDSSSIYLDWQQTPDSYAIRLSGPFAQGTTWIRGNADAVQLEQVGTAPLSAATPEALIYERLGWEIPIQDLVYWVRGIPAPQTPIVKQEKTPSGSLAFLEQAGWRLSYSHYKDIGPWQLPGKIVAQRNQLKLTLIIRRWHVGTSSLLTTHTD